MAAGKYVVRFVGGPMHCYPVPEELNGILMVLVRMGEGEPETPYSLGVHEDEETGDRYVFYGCDYIDDIDELDALIVQAKRPC